VDRERLSGAAEDTTPYECDGLTAYRERPLVVALPETEAQVAAVLRTCHRWACRWWRAAPAPACRAAPCRTPMGVTLSLAKFNRILKVDPLARTAVVQCGVRNLAISEAAAPHGLYYAPDPSQPDRLHHRRQRGRELRRRALPEVRPDAAQRAAVRASRSKARRSSSAARRSTRRATTCWPWPSAARACWR
jgi:hypothetical protein